MEEYEECAKAIEKAVTNYELIQGYILNREENVAFSIDYVKLLLQFCAVMSQNSRYPFSHSATTKPSSTLKRV